MYLSRYHYLPTDIYLLIYIAYITYILILILTLVTSEELTLPTWIGVPIQKITKEEPLSSQLALSGEGREGQGICSS